MKLKPLTKTKKAVALLSMAGGGSGGLTGARMAVEAAKNMPQDAQKLRDSLQETRSLAEQRTAHREAVQADVAAGRITAAQGAKSLLTYRPERGQAPADDH